MKPILKKRQQLIFWLYQFYLNPELSGVTVDEAVDAKTQGVLLQQLPTIEQQLKGKISPQWSWSRINNLHKAVLVQAVFECRQHHTDKPVAIDQAVEFIKTFDADQQYQFVNAVLDQVL